MTGKTGVAHAVLSHNSTSKLELASGSDRLVFHEKSENWGTGKGHNMRMNGLTPGTEYQYTWTFTAKGMQPLSTSGVLITPSDNTVAETAPKQSRNRS